MKCLLIIAAIILMYSLAVADDAEIDKKEAEMCNGITWGEIYHWAGRRRCVNELAQCNSDKK